MSTFVFGTSSRIWLDGKQAACAINDITLEQDLDEAEVTTLCSTIKDYIPGLSEVTMDMKGYFDTNTLLPATTLEAWLDARFGTTFPMTFAPEGGAQQNDPVYFMNGFLQDYKVENTVDEAASIELTMRCTTGLSRGLVLQPEATFTTTGNGTAVDNAVLTSAGATAVLSVSAASGTTPTLDVVIEHSVDNSVWVPLITFAQRNSVKAEYKTVSGTVNRYLRAKRTIAGTTPSFTFNVVLDRG